MYTLYFTVDGLSHSVQAYGLNAAQVLWTALASNSRILMKSKKP